MISTAFAQAAGASPEYDPFGFFLPMILIFAVLYFLLIRPQQKKMKEHKKMLGAIRRGDSIVTGGGIIGTVTRVIGDAELQVDLGKGLQVRVLRSMVSEVLSKPGTVPAKVPAKETDSKDQESQSAPGRHRRSRRKRGSDQE